jgi:hypothetical protein
VSSFPLVRTRAWRMRAWERLLPSWLPLPHQYHAVHPSGDYLSAVWWLGRTGSETALHFDDDPCSVLYQLLGRKRVTLFSPDQARLLYPLDRCSSAREMGTTFSDVEVLQPDLRRHPRLLNATPLVVELAAGDALFIPSGWWHHVITLEGPSISVAAKAYTFCEGMSYVPYILQHVLPSWAAALLAHAVAGRDTMCVQPPYVGAALAEIAAEERARQPSAGQEGGRRGGGALY